LTFDVLIKLKDTFDVLKFLASSSSEIRRSDPLSSIFGYVLSSFHVKKLLNSHAIWTNLEKYIVILLANIVLKRAAFSSHSVLLTVNDTEWKQNVKNLQKYNCFQCKNLKCLST
jgi:hypothetical protein